MNRGADSLKSKSNGYTIVETLIFLAVSGLMLTSAMLFISGKQGREQFQSTVRDFESRLTDIANDVSNGNYQTTEDFTCYVTAGIPRRDPDTSSGLGTNTQCIFVGMVVKLADGASGTGPEKMIQYAMMGRRQNAGSDVKSLAETNPRTINSTNNFSVSNIGAGATVGCIKIGSGACDDNNAAIGFFTTFQGSDLASQGGAALQTEVISYRDILKTDTNPGTRTKLNAAAPPINYDSAQVSRNPEITICLISGGSNQHALVRIGGGNSSRLSINSEILGGSTCS